MNPTAVVDLGRIVAIAIVIAHANFITQIDEWHAANAENYAMHQ